MKTTKPKSKPHTPNKSKANSKAKTKAAPIKSELRLFDANCTAQQIFDALIGKGK